MINRRRRGTAEIRYEMLMAAVSGNRKTHIMYQTGLNLKQLNLYLGELLAQGLLEFRPLEKQYIITNRGRAFLKAFDGYRQTVNMLDQEEAVLAGFFHTAMSRPITTPDAKQQIRSQVFDF